MPTWFQELTKYQSSKDETDINKHYGIKCKGSTPPKVQLTILHSPEPVLNISHLPNLHP
jgi:hypothetical protein